MAIEMTLPKTATKYRMDINAYWRIENLRFHSQDQFLVEFDFVGYANRESAELSKSGFIPIEAMPFGGGQEEHFFSAALYSIRNNIYHVSAVFPNGLPLSISDQKATLYAYIKTHMSGLENALDIFEEGQ